VKQEKDQSLISGKITSEHELKKATEYLINKFSLDIEADVEIATRFKQKAGQYRHNERKIRISQYLLENHPEEVIDTVKHELGHAVVMKRYGEDKSIRPHGEEWRSVMQELRVNNPQACHSLKLTKYSYIVKCSNSECSVKIGRHRKSRLVKQAELYACNECESHFESFKLE